MYERWTDRARKVMQLANQQTQRFNHEYIGTEHILLGLIWEGSGVAANVLKNLDIDFRKVRLEIENIVQAGPDVVTISKLPLTPRAKKVLEYAVEEARNLHHNYVGTEHLLLGLLREQEGVAAQVLMYLGLKLEMVREEILNLMSGGVSDAAMPERFLEEAGNDLLIWPDCRGIEAARDLPTEVRRCVDELDLQIDKFNVEKEHAVAEQDFERAAHLRDQADKLHRSKKTVYRDWPTRHPLEMSWLSWNEGTVAKLARAIAAERRWQDLPILADALEEAGCTDPEILGHCREAGDHATHCWVVDLLLGKR